MARELNQDHTAFAQIVKDSLQQTQVRVSNLRKTNTWLLLVGIVSSAATTLVAGGTAVTGPVVGDGVAGWRLACIVAAIFAFMSTVCTTFTQQLRINERLTQGVQCAGRLRALDLAIATGNQSWEDITKEYGEIVKVFPELSA